MTLRKKNPLNMPINKYIFPISSNAWNSHSAAFTVVDDGLKPLMGRDLFNQLGIAVTQCSFSPGNQVNAILPSFELKGLFAKRFPNLISHVGKSKTHVVKLNFHKKFRPRHQRGRRIPMNLQDKVNIELKKLLDEKHIKNSLIVLINILFLPL